MKEYVQGLRDECIKLSEDMDVNCDEEGSSDDSSN